MENHPQWKPPTKDKRTKTYKEYKEAFEKAHANDSKGLGDTIKKVTKATGIDKLFDSMGIDCGCDDRQKKWNQKNPYKIIQCPTESQFNWMEKFLNREDKHKLTYDDRVKLCDTLNHVFSKKLDITMKCGSCWKGEENQLKRLYESYK